MAIKNKTKEKKRNWSCTDQYTNRLEDKHGVIYINFVHEDDQDTRGTEYKLEKKPRTNR